MAPLRPLPKKNSLPQKSILKTRDTTATQHSRAEPLFATSKKDKRRIRHATLISKITKPTSVKSRRRRPNKKLVTTLDALADALPDNTETLDTTDDGGSARLVDQVNVIKRKSMKSRPGAMKRKQKLDNDERDRFAKNMAQMAAPTSAAGAASASSTDKLRALRSFISQTLEKRPDLRDGNT